MIKMENFDLVNPSGISYGGHGESKRGIIIDNERWFLKYPKLKKNKSVAEPFYLVPLSEYIGSHIYETIGIDTHKTKLGIANGKVVVACKDIKTILNPTILVIVGTKGIEEDGKRINPLKYIESMSDEECNKAILKIVPQISLNKIGKVFEEIAEEYNGLPVLSKMQKTYCLKSLEYKYHNVLVLIYNKLLKLETKY